MYTIPLQQVRMAPLWRPAPIQAHRQLGQQAPTTTTPAQIPQQGGPPAVIITSPPPLPAPALIDSALVAAIQSFIGSYITGSLAYGATYPGGILDPETGKKVQVKPSRWAYVFLIASVALGFKGFADLARIRER